MISTAAALLASSANPLACPDTAGQRAGSMHEHCGAALARGQTCSSSNCRSHGGSSLGTALPVKLPRSEATSGKRQITAVHTKCAWQSMTEPAWLCLANDAAADRKSASWMAVANAYYRGTTHCAEAFARDIKVCPACVSLHSCRMRVIVIVLGTESKAEASPHALQSATCTFKSHPYCWRTPAVRL